MKTIKRVIPLLLVVVLVLGLFPLGAFASGGETVITEDPSGEIAEITSDPEAAPGENGEEITSLSDPPPEADGDISAMLTEAPEAVESEQSEDAPADNPALSPVPEETEQPDASPPTDEPDGEQDVPPSVEPEGEDGAPSPEPTAEPEETAVPVETPDQDATPDPEATAVPEATEEPSPTPEAQQRVGRNILPDPISGYDPLDPSNPYPYGEPVDNFFPPEFDEDDSNGIVLMAQGSIPDSLWDNSILRALAYTGFNVQKLKDNNRLYKYEYISGSLLTNDSSVLSNIGYGEYPNGDETVSNGSTPTGKAPNIAYFESNGLVCASFVNYYINNYLRNIEGVDTSAISTALGNVGTSVRVVSTWVSALTTLSSNPSSGVTRYTNASTAYANLVPGDIIAFKNDSGTWMHLAVYAGTYTLYRTSGTSLGTYHFIIHVGNDRGPEISTAEYMANAGAKSSKPAEWYHLTFNDTSKGNLKIVKTSDDGNVSGITFTIQGGSVNQTVTTGWDGTFTIEGLTAGTYTVTETVPAGYTNSAASQTVTVANGQTATVYFHNSLKTGSLKIVKTSEDGKVSGITFTIDGNGVSQSVVTGSDGSITVPGLKPGTYTVTETVPAGYSSSAASQTVTVQYDQTATVNFYNSLKTGDLKIIKKSDDGKVSGIQFTITGNGVNKTVISGTDGTIIEKGLKPGTYTVTEKVPDGYVCDNASQSVTVKYDQTATVIFNNKLKTGNIKIVKTSDDGNVSGITFTVKGGSVDQTVTSGTDGTITVPGLVPGTYTVTEQVSESYVCDQPSQTVTVEYDKTTTVNFKNTLKKWRITVVKEDAEGDIARYGDATLTGAMYGVYKDGQLQDTYTTDQNHSFTTDYYVCGSGWTIREITASPGYTVDPTVYEIGAEPGDFTIADNSLDLSVPERIIKGALLIVKQDEEDQRPLEGATFRVYDENGETVAEVTTGPDGKATFPDLQYGEYTYQEVTAPKYFQLDENIYDFAIVEDGVTITHTRDDTRIPGSITVHKNDTRGNALSGAEYLLEWSTDGRSWKPVESRPDTPPVKTGFCTSPGLVNGRLTTGSDGTVTFSGLRADGEIQYRLTETKAPAGMELLKDPVYTGTLPVEGRDDLIYDISYTVTDNRITELPHTGAPGFDPVTIGTVLTGLAGCAGIFFTKKSKRRNAK